MSEDKDINDFEEELRADSYTGNLETHEAQIDAEHWQHDPEEWWRDSSNYQRQAMLVSAGITDLNLASFEYYDLSEDIQRQLAEDSIMYSPESKAEEHYGVGTPAGDIIWKHFNEVHSMDQDDVFCNHCGKMMTEPVRKAGIAGDGEGGLAQQQVYFDHLKQHGITESKANEDYPPALPEGKKYCPRCGGSGEIDKDIYGQSIGGIYECERCNGDGLINESYAKEDWLDEDDDAPAVSVEEAISILKEYPDGLTGLEWSKKVRERHGGGSASFRQAELQGLAYVIDSKTGERSAWGDKWVASESYAKEDSLVKIEDNNDDDTQVTVLDEWENETDPDVGGKTEDINATEGRPLDDWLASSYNYDGITLEDTSQEWWDNNANPSEKARILNKTGSPVENTFNLPNYDSLSEQTKTYLSTRDNFSFESKATEKSGYRKRSTGYGTYFYEEKSKINCQNCGKEIYETDGDTFHTTKCRYCGHVNLTSDLTYESKANETVWTYDCDYCNYSEKSEYPDIEGHLKNVHGITDYEEIKWARSLLEKDPESVDPYEEEMLPFYGESKANEKMWECGKCDGTGKDEFGYCYNCKGTGQLSEEEMERKYQSDQKWKNMASQNDDYIDGSDVPKDGFYESKASEKEDPMHYKRSGGWNILDKDQNNTGSWYAKGDLVNARKEADRIDGHVADDETGSFVYTSWLKNDIPSWFVIESYAREYSIKEEYDLQDEDGKYEMLAKSDVPSFISSDYAKMGSYDALPQNVKDQLHVRFGSDGGFGESKATEEFYDVLNPKSLYGWNGKWNDLDPDMKYKVTDAYLKETSGNFFDLSEEEKNEYAMGYVREYNADMEYANAEKGEYNFKPDGAFMMNQANEFTQSGGKWYGKWNDLDPDMKHQVAMHHRLGGGDSGVNFEDLSEEEKDEYAIGYVLQLKMGNAWGVESKATEVNYDYNKIEGGSTIEYYGYDGRTGELDGSVKKGKAWLKGPAGWVVGGGNGTIVDERSFVSSESKASELQHDEYEVDVDEYIKTGEPVQKVPTDKRSYNVESTTWTNASFNRKLDALESLGITQGDAVRLASVAYEDLSEDLKKDLELPYTEEDAETEQEIFAQNEEKEEDVDYNNIGESKTARTKYECEHCNCGFKSNESLSIHYNQIHAVAPEPIEGYENWKDVADDLYEKEQSRRKKGGEGRYVVSDPSYEHQDEYGNFHGEPVMTEYDDLETAKQQADRVSGVVLDAETKPHPFTDVYISPTYNFANYKYNKTFESKASEVWIDIFYYIQSKPQGVTYEELEEKFGDRSDFKYFLFDHILDGASKKLAYWDGELIKAHESKAKEHNYLGGVPAKLKDTQCPECGSYDSLYEHETHGDLQCEVCGGAFEWEQVAEFNNVEVSDLGESKANEIGIHGGDGASFYDGKTFTCTFCGKIGDDFSIMAQEICPSNNGNGHQVPIFGDQVKPKPIPTLSGESLQSTLIRGFDNANFMDQDDMFNCKECGQLFDVWNIEHGLHQNPEEVLNNHLQSHESYAKEEGTSDGAKKGWLTRKRGGSSAEEPSNVDHDWAGSVGYTKSEADQNRASDLMNKYYELVDKPMEDLPDDGSAMEERKLIHAKGERDFQEYLTTTGRDVGQDVKDILEDENYHSLNRMLDARMETKKNPYDDDSNIKSGIDYDDDEVSDSQSDQDYYDGITQNTMETLQQSTVNGFPFFSYIGKPQQIFKDGKGGVVLYGMKRNPNSVRKVDIMYDEGADTYSVRFVSNRGKVKGEYSDVYFDQLSDIIVGKKGLGVESKANEGLRDLCENCKEGTHEYCLFDPEGSGNMCGCSVCGNDSYEPNEYQIMQRQFGSDGGSEISDLQFESYASGAISKEANLGIPFEDHIKGEATDEESEEASDTGVSPERDYGQSVNSPVPSGTTFNESDRKRIKDWHGNTGVEDEDGNVIEDRVLINSLDGESIDEEICLDCGDKFTDEKEYNDHLDAHRFDEGL